MGDGGEMDCQDSAVPEVHLQELTTPLTAQQGTVRVVVFTPLWNN